MTDPSEKVSSVELESVKSESRLILLQKNEDSQFLTDPQPFWQENPAMIRF